MGSTGVCRYEIPSTKIDLSFRTGGQSGDFLTCWLAAELASATIPFAYRFAMATRRRDRALRDSLQTVLDTKRPEIDAILKSFNVPLLPDAPATKAGGTGR